MMTEGDNKRPTNIPIKLHWHDEAYRVEKAMRAAFSGMDIKKINRRGVNFFININTTLVDKKKIKEMREAQHSEHDPFKFSLDDMMHMAKLHNWHTDEAIFWLRHYIIRSHEMYRIFREMRMGTFELVPARNVFSHGSKGWDPIRTI